MQESKCFVLEELNFCISQHLKELFLFNLQGAKDIFVETVGELEWHNVNFQCMKNLENFVKQNVYQVLKKLFLKKCEKNVKKM